MSVSMISVQKLLQDLKEFESMDGNRQGAFRARLTRYLNEVEDEQVRRILEQVRERVGEAEKRASQKLTAEDLEAEFPSFTGYDSKRRGAYKAKLTRLLNEARDEGDTQSAERLAALAERIESLEEAEKIANVLDLAAALGLDLGDEEE
jgi:formate dehydrogenase maturation protein FdhE